MHTIYATTKNNFSLLIGSNGKIVVFVGPHLGQILRYSISLILPIVFNVSSLKEWIGKAYFSLSKKNTEGKKNFKDSVKDEVGLQSARRSGWCLTDCNTTARKTSVIRQGLEPWLVQSFHQSFSDSGRYRKCWILISSTLG